MKNLKFLLGLFVLVFMVACTSDTDITADDASAVESTELEKRTIRDCGGLRGCQAQVGCALDNLASAINSGNASEVVVRMGDLSRIIDYCNGDFVKLPDCDSDYGTDCDDIATGGTDADGNSNNDGACPRYMNYAYCKLLCRTNNYNPESSVSDLNLRTSFCDYVRALEFCFELGLNDAGYCNLVGR